MSQHSIRNKDVSLTIVLIVLVVVLTILFRYLKESPTTAAPSDAVISLSSAEALSLDVAFSELPLHEADWIAVRFPFHWRDQFSDTRAVWYRMTISADQLNALQQETSQPHKELLGLYVWRLNQTADVWINGEKIGSGGNTTEPMARYWNSPLYFSIPPSVIQETNQILIKHFSQSSWGSMEPIVLGRENVLKPIYEKRVFVQHDIALGLFAFVLTTGVLCLMVWGYRRKDSEYLWFALSSAGLSINCLNQFIRYLPISADAWRWLTNVAIDFWAVTALIFILRSLEIRKPLAEIAVSIFLLSGLPIYYYASFYQRFDINIYYHIGALVIAAYGFYISIHCYLVTKKALAAFYCCVILIVFVAGVHDIGMQAIVNNGWQESGYPSFQNHFNAAHFAAPLIFMAIGASLIKRFVDSMNEADRLNRDLEERVELARKELDENYHAMEKVLIKQSASEERERIYRDLHDDVGSKLLSLYYRLEKESDSVLAKSALEDLRDIVSRKSLESCPLQVAVEQWHSEIRERASDSGIVLSWHFDTDSQNISNPIVLSEKQHSHLRRMLREVLSNAILHSKQITELSVSIKVLDSTLAIDVANDGAPKPVSAWTVGRGISNLRVRSRDLDGEFAINDKAGTWVQVSWKIPIQPSSVQ